MIKQAIEYIVGLSKDQVIEVNDRKYSIENLYPVNEPKIPGFETSTLASMVDYLKEQPDGVRDQYIISIEGPQNVKLQTAIYGQFNTRSTIIECAANIPGLTFGKFVSSEQFIIELQSKFTKTEDREILKKVVGNIKGETVRNFGDNGVSQKVEIKQGIATVAEAVVPNPVVLAPYRSFPEIEQIESEFIFRMREGSGIEMALFEADGGAWRIQAIASIKRWIEMELKINDIDNVTVLA